MDDDWDDLDREAQRIISMTDEEILREAISEGRDIELEVAEVTAIIELAIARSR